MIKRKLHFLKLGILFFGISLLLLNCIDENNIDLNENLSIEQVNDFQSIETDEAKNLINNIVTKNKNQFQKGGFSVTIDEKSLYFSEVKKTNLNIPTFSASVKPNIHSKVFMVKKQDSVYTCLYNYIPFENKNADFLSGAIIISTIDGAFINGYKVIDGVFVSQYKQETNRETAPKTFRKDAEPNDDWWDLGSLEEISLTLSGAGGGSIVFTNSHDPVSNQGWMNLNLSGSLFGGAGGGNPNGGNGGSSNPGEMPLFPCDNPTPRGCEEEDDQIFNELTGKADCVFKKLLSTGVSNPHNIITDLFMEFGDNNFLDRDLTFKMSNDLPNGVGGKTEYYGNGKYGILINVNLMNTLSSIEVSAILVHEIAHAFLGKHYNDLNSSFSKLYKKYINDTGIQNYSHDIMRDQFINRMAIAIKNYDSSIFTDFVDYKILASQGVFELTKNQEDDLLAVKLISRKNDTNCND
ncbi:MAG: hypothetical protein P8L21_01290 [Polaribacter sp.]|nr:hypothetical protein [Polaribacter sp.]